MIMFIDNDVPWGLLVIVFHKIGLGRQFFLRWAIFSFIYLLNFLNFINSFFCFFFWMLSIIILIIVWF